MAVYPKIAEIIAAALPCEIEKVKLDASLIDDLGAQSIDFLDIVFRLERAFKVKIPRGKIIEEARGNLSQAEFEQAGVVSPAGLERLKAFLSEVPPERLTSPLKVADIPRLFTTETFCKIVIRQQRATPRQPTPNLPDGDAPGPAAPMDAHFRAFSFVDRITSVRNGTQIRGHYAIPSDVDEFPVSLVGEAVGQLAAWAAMSALKFTHRPIAGLAGCIEFPGGAERGHSCPQQLPNGKQLIEPPCGPQNVTADRNVRAPLSTPSALRESSSTAQSWSSALRPHGVLELAANLESVDTESVAYNGTAHADGRLVVRLQDCLGPMVPLADLDDPQALANRFDLLCGPGAAPGGFRGLPPLALERTAGETGRRRALLSKCRPRPPFSRTIFPGVRSFPAAC